MKTPEYKDRIIVGGSSQTTIFGALPKLLINRQSGKITLIHEDPDGLPHDISALTGADWKCVPYDSGETPTTLATGVVGYTQEIFTLETSDTPDTSGTFVLRVAGENTAAIAYNADASAIQSALEALPSRSGGDFVVSIEAKENLSFAGAKVLIKTSGGFAISYDSTLDDTNLPLKSISLTVNQSGSDIQNEYSATWVKDSIPANFSEFDFDRDGAIAFFVGLEDGDDFIQTYQRITIEDDAFVNQGGSLPSSATYIYNPSDNNAWLRKSPTSPTTLNAGLDTLVLNNYLNRTVQDILTTPPGSPADGDAYLVGAAGATGDWAGKENKVARYSSTLAGWTFSNVHKEGDEVLNLADGGIYRVNSDDTTWSAAPISGVLNQDEILGRASSGSGSVEALTSGQVRSILNISNVDNTSDADKPVSTAQQSALDDKLDDDAQAVDSAKFAGYTLDASNISNGRVIAMKSGLTEFEFVDQSGGGGSGGFDFPYLFSTDITATDPTSGGIKFNNATPASVTEIYISSTDNDGMLIDTLINSLGSGDQFVLKQSDTPGNRLRFNVTSVTDNTGWITIAGSVADSGPLPSNGSACGTGFEYVSGGGGSGVTSVNGQTGAVTTPTETDELNLSAGVTVAGSTTTDALNNLDANKMATATYDAAGIAEQLVGLTASQSLTNKSVNGVTLNGSGSASLFLDQTGNYSLPPGAGGGESNTTSNQGSGTGQLAMAKSGTDLPFKTLVGGSGISLINGSDTVTINGTGEANAGTNLGGGEGIYASKSSTNLQFKSLVAGSGVALSSTANEITITSTGGGGGFPSGNISVTQSATPTIDWALGDTFELGVLTLTNTISFANVSQGQTIAITFTIDAGASYTVNLPGTVTALEGGSVDNTANTYNTIYLTAINSTTEQHAAFSTDVASTIDTTAVNGWTGQQYFVEQTLTDGANIAWNLNTEQTATVTLAGNRTLDNPTNLQAGATYILRVVQDATGSRTLAYGANYKWSGGTAPTLTTTANAVDILTFYCDGTNMYGNFAGDFS